VVSSISGSTIARTKRLFDITVGYNTETSKVNLKPDYVNRLRPIYSQPSNFEVFRNSSVATRKKKIGMTFRATEARVTEQIQR